MGLDNAEMDQDLLENGVIYLCGEINRETASQIGKAIAWLNRPVPEEERKKEILLYIDSAEGNMTAALDMFDIIRFSQIPVTGIVYRQACYAAAIVRLACHKRAAMQHAIIRFTSVKVTGLTFKDIEDDIDKRLRTESALQDACIKIVASHSIYASPEEAQKFIASSMTLTTDEAVGRDIIEDVFYTAPPYMPYFSAQIVKRENREF